MAVAVYQLDGWLRRREAVFEYSSNSDCIFRIQRQTADEEVTLSDGTVLRPGDPLIRLHLWNEQIPPMGRSGPNVAWARAFSRRLESSLRELDMYLDQESDLRDVKALVADMALGAPGRGEQVVRISGRHGFEAAGEASCADEYALRVLGENILMLLLVLATNPASARLSYLRRERRRVYLSRAVLRERYSADGRFAITSSVGSGHA
ncbi:MAG: YkoP family protein [Pararhizobium sp.]